MNNRSIALNKSKDKFFGILLFFVWPTLAIWLSIKKFYSQSFVFVLGLCGFFFGLFLDTDRTGSDAEFHAKKFQEIAEMDFNQFFTYLGLVFQGAEKKIDPDYYVPIADFLLSRFSINPKLIFALTGFFLIYFTAKLILLVASEAKFEIKRIAWIFILILIFINPINNIQHVRFQLAIVVYIYGLIKYLYTKDLRALVYCLIVPLIHFSMALAVLITALFFVFRHSIKIYYFFLAISLVAPGLGMNLLSSYVESSDNQTLLHKVEGYSDEESIESQEERTVSKVWYARYYFPALANSLITGFFLFGLIWARSFKKDTISLSLYSLGLLFLTFINFGDQVESLGFRYRYMFMYITIILLFRLINQNYHDAKAKVTYVLYLPTLLWILIQVRKIDDAFDLSVFIFNPLAYLFYY